MAELVCGRYSDAFFELGKQEDQLERFAQDAKLVLDMLTEPQEGEDASLGRFLYHPQISEDSKISVVEGALKDKVHDDVLGLIIVIIRKQRERELADVLQSFLNKVDQYNELAEAYLTSAVPIDDGRLETIRTILGEKFGKRIVLRTGIDKDLIGGFKILILGYSFDRTIRTSINELTASID
jgi:F-type H+-transporting ATPase subunit delta